MPLIKPRTRGKEFIRLITRLDRANTETLYAYAQFIGEPAEYVLNQLVEAVLAKDKEFITWRAERPDSYVPLPRRQQQQAVKVDRARRASRTHAAAATNGWAARNHQRGVGVQPVAVPSTIALDHGCQPDQPTSREIQQPAHDHAIASSVEMP